MASPERFSPIGLRRLASVLNSISFRDEKGEVEYFGQKVVMLRRDAFRLMVEELSKRQAEGTAKILLGIVGQRVGQEEGKALVATSQSMDMDRGSTPQFIRTAVEETNLGYGKISLKELEVSSGSAEVSVLNSFEADPPGHSENATCFFLLGYLEGLFSQLLNKNMRGLETRCMGKGDENCSFELSPVPPSKWKL